MHFFSRKNVLGRVMNVIVIVIANIIVFVHGKYSKILYTRVADKMAYANSADAEEQSGQGLHCLPFR